MSQPPISLEKVTITMLAPQILENRFHDGVTVTIDDIQELKKLNMELTKHKPYGTLVFFGALTDYAPGTRELASSKEFAQTNVAKAFMVTNLGHRMLAQAYIAINKPAVKTAAFTKQEKAVAWLKKKVEEAELCEQEA